MHLLDTDTLTHLHAGHRKVVESLRVLDDTDVGTTIITKIELIRGRMDFVLKASTGPELLRAQHLLTRTEELLEQIIIVPIDDVAAAQFDLLRTSRRFRKIGRADLLIASIALANSATVVTRNVRHFKVLARLKVVNWVD